MCSSGIGSAANQFRQGFTGRKMKGPATVLR
jgi:hypothetical protein